MYCKITFMMTLEKILRAVCDGFTPDPGTSDLDDEQQINVRMTLGDYRACRALFIRTDLRNRG